MTGVEEFYQQMRADFAARTGMEAAEGCDLAARMYALAAQLYALQMQGDWVRRQCFPQTAQGENLDNHAKMRGLTRKQAARAEGMVRFFVESASEVSRSIPVGTVCMTAGLVRFETTAAAVLEAGEMWVDVPVQALEAGAAGNVPAGSITAMAVAPVGIAACSNPGACPGGADEEDDESLRARVIDTFRSLPNGANAAYYRALAMADEEVAAAVVVPRPRGVGTVDVVVASRAGVPDEELLSRLQSKLDAEREIAVDLQVIAPKTVPVVLNVQVAAGADFDAAQVIARVKAALTGWFTGARLGQDVLLVQLGSIIYGCEGVENYRIEVPSVDLAVGSTQLPVLESLSVEAMA